MVPVSFPAAPRRGQTVACFSNATNSQVQTGLCQVDETFGSRNHRLASAVVLHQSSGDFQSALMMNTLHSFSLLSCNHVQNSKVVNLQSTSPSSRQRRGL